MQLQEQISNGFFENVDSLYLEDMRVLVSSKEYGTS